MNAVKKVFSIKTIKFIVIIIDSIVPLIIIPYGTDYFYYPKINAIYILLALAVLITCVSIKLGTVKLRISKELLPLISFMLMIILSTVFSPYKAQAFWGRPGRLEGMLTYLSYFLIFYFSWLSIEGEEDIKTLLRFLIPSASIIALYGILQYAGIDPIPRDNIREAWKHVSFSTSGNPNFLGSYLALMFPTTLFLYISGKFKSYNALLFMANIILFAALLITYTRSAWLGTLLSLFFMLILQLIKLLSIAKSKKYNESRSENKANFHFVKLFRIVVITCVLIFSVIILNKTNNGLIISRFKSIINDYKTITDMDHNSAQVKSIAGSQRIFIWARSMNYIFERPLLGSGPDTFDHVFHMNSQEAEYHFGSSNIYVDKAHNEYLQILVTLGFPALLLYILFLYTVLRNPIFNLIHNKNNLLNCCIFSGVLAYIIQAFFNISVVSVAPVYWSLLGVVNSIHNRS